MNAQNYIANKLAGELANYGRGRLSVKYPSEIEMYLVAFELVDSLGKTLQYFVFPIMPNSISKVENNRVNIKKSSSGTTVLMSPSFTANEISLKGDFGRSFKFLTNPTGNDFQFAIFKETKGNKLNITYPELDPAVKSGYGCIKILQNMILMANKLDGHYKPHRLYFYNMALGESYLVSVLPGGLTLSQAIDRNMIWGYTLTMQAIANLEDLKSSEDYKKSSKSLLSAQTVSNGVNILVGEVKGLL